MAFPIMLALMAAQAVSSQNAAEGNAQVAKINANANAVVANMTRKANNMLSAAQGQLNRYNQIVGRKAQARNVESAMDALATNFLRSAEEATRGRLDRRIQAAEEAGMLRASASAAGVGGSTMDMINATNQLRQARVEEVYAAQEGRATSDMQEASKALTAQIYLGMDDMQLVDELNLAKVLPQQTQKAPTVGAAALGFAADAAKLYAQTGYTFKSTPTPTSAGGPSTRWSPAKR